MGNRRARADAPLDFVLGEIVCQVAIVPGVKPDLRRYIRLHDEGHQIVTPIGALDLEHKAFRLAQLPPKAVAHGEAQPHKIGVAAGPRGIAQVHNIASLADRVASHRNAERLWVHRNSSGPGVISLQAEDSTVQNLFIPVMPEHPEPHLGTAREVGHTVDEMTVVTVREEKSGRGRRMLQPGDIYLRQVRTADEVRLHYSARHVAVRSDPKQGQVRENRHVITWCAVLLQVAGGFLQNLGELSWIADAVEFQEAGRTLD